MPLDFGDILVYAVTGFGLYTAIFFMLTVFQHRYTLYRRPTGWRPKVCIIVPCFNEENTVEGTVNSLLGLDYPKDKLEIFVVDDGSTDNTYKVAKRFEKQGVKVFRKKNGGKYTALNYGLKRTDAEIVGALDADSFVEPDTLVKMLPFFEDADVMGVTPSMKIYQPQNWLQRIQMIEYLFGIFLRKVFALLGSVHIAPGPFTIYRKWFFDNHGPYREAYLTEDCEIALRIQALGYQLENCLDAYVHTIGPSKFKPLYTQRLRWYHGFIRNVEDYDLMFNAKQGNLGMFILPSAFLSVFLVILTVGYTGFKLLTNLWDKYVMLRAIGFDWSQMIELNWDTFFINFSPVTVLSIFTICLSITLILISKRLAFHNENIKYAYVLNVLFYWLLFGFWWLMSFYHRIFNRKVQWGKNSTG